MEKKLLFRQNNGLSSPLTCLSVSPKGKLIACGNTDSSVFIVDEQTGKLKQTIEGHTGKVTGVAFVRDRFHLLSCSWDATTRFWDTREKGEPLTLKHGTEVKTLTIKQELGKGAAGSRDGEIKIFSLGSMKNLRNIQAHNSDISGLTILPEKSKLVTSSWDGECKLWNLGSYEMEAVLVSENARIRSLTSTPDEQMIILGMHDGTIMVIDVDSPSTIKKLTGHSDIVASLSIDSTGDRLVSGSWDRSVRLWSLSSYKEKSSDRLLAGINAVAWAPTDELFYTADYSGAITSWGV